MRRSDRPPQSDLFGPAPPRARDDTPLTIPMREVHAGTPVSRSIALGLPISSPF